MLLFLCSDRNKNMTETTLALAPERVNVQQEHSVRLLEAAVQTSEELTERFHEYLGSTVFGSVARDEAGPNSDIDLYVYIKPTEDSQIQSNPAVSGEPKMGVRGGEGPLADDVVFHPAIEMDYKWPISRSLAQKGVAKTDINVYPISDEIVDMQTTKVLEAAAKRDAGQDVGSVAPRNIRGLFHGAVQTEELKPFQARVIQRFSQSLHGETAWKMVRDVVIGFEQGRNSDFTASHRYIPEDLVSAQSQFIEVPYT